MPRDEQSRPRGPGRRAFLRACAATAAAAALPTVACSGPQDLPERPPLREPDPRAEPPRPVEAPPPGALPRSPWLAVLRELPLADGVEPATVFVAAVEDR